MIATFNKVCDKTSNVLKTKTLKLVRLYFFLSKCIQSDCTNAIRFIVETLYYCDYFMFGNDVDVFVYDIILF